MSKIEVDAIEPQSGTALTVGASGDTITVPSGAILTTTNATVNLPATTTVSTELKTNKISPATGTAFTFGDSGDTFTVPAGATITNSGTATGFGGGKILQFVVNNDNTNTSNTSSSTYVAATGVDIDITPTSASSKIFVEFNVCVYQTIASGSQDSSFQYELYRDTTLIHTNGSVQYYTSAGWSGNVRYMRYFSRLDTPSTTSAINYNFKFRNPHNSGSIQVNNGSMFSDIRAMEIAG